MKDYYEILEVHPKASHEIIKKAYITLAKKYHPDTTEIEAEYAKIKMQEINEAYAILSDKKKRMEYDSLFFAKQTHSTDQTSWNTDEKNETTYSEIDIAKIHLSEICYEYIEILDKKIIKNASFIEKNKLVCKPLLKDFYKKIEKDYKFLLESNELNGEVAEMLAVTLYSFAVGLTWCNDFIEATSTLNMALSMIDAESNIYKKIYDAKCNIEKEAVKQQSVESDSRSTGNSFLKKLCLIAILLGGIFLFNIFSSEPSNDVKSVQTSVKATDSKKQVLTPRTNIKTGYDRSFKVLNSKGLCELTIDNTRNSEPVYVRLWSKNPDKPVRAFYIAARDKFTLRKLNAGTYELRYKYLYENQEAEKGVKSESFDMIQEEDYRGVSYSVFAITLYKVANGNFHTTSIDAGDI